MSRRERVLQWPVLAGVVVGLVVGAVGLPVAQAAYDAVNADKVDGRHAVGANTSADRRAGKLVATDARGRVPDAARLGGVPAASYRMLEVPGDDLAGFGSGVVADHRGVSTIRVGEDVHVMFQAWLPPTRAAGAPLRADLHLEPTGRACEVSLSAGPWSFERGTTVGDRVVTLSPTDPTVLSLFWRGEPAGPLDLVELDLVRRVQEPGASTCGAVVFRAARVHY